jgi:hypothetical protein
MGETDIDRPERSWAGYSGERSLLDRYFVLVVGLCSGALGGMGAFMANQSALVPKVAPFVGRSGWALAVTALGGAFAFLLARDIRESVVGMLVGSAVALVVMTGATVFPVYALPFSSIGRGVIVQFRLGRLVPTVFGVLVLVYWGGYLTAVSVLGYFEP